MPEFPTDSYTPTMSDLSPKERAVAAVLGRYGLTNGQYHEDASGMEWLAMEAVDVSYAIDEGMSPSSVLYSTGFWTEDDGPFPERLNTELVAAHNGHAETPGSSRLNGRSTDV